MKNSFLAQKPNFSCHLCSTGGRLKLVRWQSLAKRARVERNSGKRHTEKASHGRKLNQIGDYTRRYILRNYRFLCASAE